MQPELIDIAFRYLFRDSYVNDIPLPQPTKCRIVATSFDTYSQVVQKYPESKEILRKVDTLEGAQVLHGVNAWELATAFPDQKFDASMYCDSN